MASAKSHFLPLALCLASILVSSSSAQLSSTFYQKSCPKALPTIKAAVQAAVAKEARMGASLLRLHFHDCFVNGCDGSILLDDTSSFTGEKTAGPNVNSARGFDVIDTIKGKVESVCRNTVSCADILAVAARDSIVALGGPSWDVLLGRRDARTASLGAANSDIPSPSSSFGQLSAAFSNKGLSARDMVALSGAHTIGQARCFLFRARAYGESNINSTYANLIRGRCPRSGGDNNLSPLDIQTPTTFDNDYYTNLMSLKGLLHSDQQLFNGGPGDSQVRAYSSSTATFFGDFTRAMINMGNISPLTGRRGEVRVNCRRVN